MRHAAITPRTSSAAYDPLARRLAEIEADALRAERLGEHAFAESFRHEALMVKRMPNMAEQPRPNRTIVGGRSWDLGAARPTGAAPITRGTPARSGGGGSLLPTLLRLSAECRALSAAADLARINDVLNGPTRSRPRVALDPEEGLRKFFGESEDEWYS